MDITPLHAAVRTNVTALVTALVTPLVTQLPTRARSGSTEIVQVKSRQSYHFETSDFVHCQAQTCTSARFVTLLITPAPSRPDPVLIKPVRGSQSQTVEALTREAGSIGFGS